MKTNAMQIGQVKQVADDPAGDFRVQVTIPAVNGGAPLWARLAQFYASSPGGAAFFPEVGDEVVIAFIDDNPSDPVILGSLFSRAHPPGLEPVQGNDVKTIVSRTGMAIRFDDKDMVLQLSTPGGRVVTLDDANEIVTITDGLGSITMTEHQVEISAPAAMVLKAAGDMTIEAGGSISVKAGTDLSLAALDVAADAENGLSLSGTATAELKASGEVTIRGAMVMIN